MNLSKESLQEHLSSVSESSLKAVKENAWKEYQDTSLPKRTDEPWRFSNIQRIEEPTGQIVVGIDDSLRSSVLERSNLVKETSGTIVFVDDNLAEASLSPELADQGVLFQPLSEVDPAFLAKELEVAEAKLGSAKFAALHKAFCRAGVYLSIPKNLEIKDPFVVYHWGNEDNAVVFPHTLIDAGENSKSNYIEFFFSTTSTNKTLSIGLENVRAKAGAKVLRKTIQNWNEESVSYQVETNEASRDSLIRNIALHLGAKQARYENLARMLEPGSDVHSYSLTIGDKNQEFDQRSLQEHIGAHATSDLLYKNVLLDKAHSIFSGLIDVKEEAQQTDAYQTNRNLLLSTDARADSLPGLEIEANDVKCSHGSTTGQLDQDELFYMLSRGISLKIAKQLLVFGFFEEILEKVGDEDLEEMLREIIRSKFEIKLG